MYTDNTRCVYMYEYMYMNIHTNTHTYIHIHITCTHIPYTRQSSHTDSLVSIDVKVSIVISRAEL